MNEKSKGAGKGSKSKQGKKSGAPIDPQAFKQEPSMVRDHLGNMTFARYPFNTSIRELLAGNEQQQQHQHEHAKRTEMDVDQTGQAPKRNAENETEQQAKRRSPTPGRASAVASAGTPYPPLPAHQLAHGFGDPWAAAAASSSQGSPLRMLVLKLKLPGMMKCQPRAEARL